jgi:hypothetical protein
MRQTAAAIRVPDIEAPGTGKERVGGCDGPLNPPPETGHCDIVGR